MKKLIATVMALFTMVSFGIAMAAGTEETKQADDAAFEAQAAAEIRQRYEEKGYTEVQRPSTFSEINEQLNIDPAVRALAYMDLEKATPEMQAKILEARKDIIYQSRSWYVDDGNAYIVWFNDNTREWGELPKFSELFPGWDVPKNSAVVDWEQGATFFPETRSTPIFNGGANLAYPQPTIMTLPFRTWTLPTSIVYFRETITGLNKSAHCNLGVASSINQDIFYDTYLGVGSGLEGLLRNYPVVGFRASTYSTQGTAYINIVYDPK